MLVTAIFFAVAWFGVVNLGAQEDRSLSNASRITEYTRPQLERMLAPIALYPDPLVAQILMASTYPLEVAEAASWLQHSNNIALHGEPLAAALQDLSWDPSVKALVVFPDIVRMMNSNLQWTEELGDAFIGQQAEVMDEIQRLRQLALTAGTLRSTPTQTVTVQDGIITIEPADPDLIYVPYYNPMFVYGTWPYPDYPPYYFASDYDFDGPLIDFGIGIGIFRDLFFFHRCDFRHHRIDIDDQRFRALNGGHPPIRPGVWTFDPAHRHNVPHHASPLRGNMGVGRVAVPPAQRPFRGFGVGGAASVPQPRAAVVAPGPQEFPAQAPVGRQGHSRVNAPVHAPVTPPVILLTPQTPPAQTLERSRPSGNVMRPSAPPTEYQVRRPSPVFESHTPSFNARMQSERGQSSRSEMEIHREQGSFGGGARQTGGSEYRGGSGSPPPSSGGRWHR